MADLEGSDDKDVRCRQVHHGAAATSSSHTMVWIPSDISHSGSSNEDNTTQIHPQGEIVYASHAILNIAGATNVALSQSPPEPVWNVHSTLRTSHTINTASPHETQPVIKSISYLRQFHTRQTDGDGDIKPPANAATFLACGFSNGTINVWTKTAQHTCWSERILVDGLKPSSPERRSVTSIDGLWWSTMSGPSDSGENSSESQQTIGVVLATSSSNGTVCTIDTWSNSTNERPISHQEFILTTHPSNVVRMVQLKQPNSNANIILVLVGTAAPRHNKIHVYKINPEIQLSRHDCPDKSTPPVYCGPLTGHEDWITCYDWKELGTQQPSIHHMLASGGQDCKIRLWRFTSKETTTLPDREELVVDQEQYPAEVDPDNDSGDDDDDDNDDQDDEQESRLEIYHQSATNIDSKGDTTAVETAMTLTTVSLEALLIGHEEGVTAVTWHPNPRLFYGHASVDVEEVLISCSMDRSILIWTPSKEDAGIWTPLTRVGSAGGILGGSIGSTLLGFLNVQVEPIRGSGLVGHGYGGALHFWNASTSLRDGTHDSQLTAEECFAQLRWRAVPCLTGHFGGVTDLCWEASNGDYLLTVSQDQTCRLWGQVKTDPGKYIWVELARPQVHGYNLTAITSLSTLSHPHLIVSGADEKELRTFDAPMTTLRMLDVASAGQEKRATNDKDEVDRVERAFIPSLGLSNKASAVEAAEEEVVDEGIAEDGKNTGQSLPLERDLGALSLWLESRKLFGHNTEIFCLTSTLAARNATEEETAGGDNRKLPYGDVIVASSAKARDVDAAAIRLWNPYDGKCLQILSGGHKSTVSTLAFSPDGQYLASSGKDRRLCVWRRNDPQAIEPGTQTDIFFLWFAKDSAHKRIIWSVHFCPFNSSVLASGSRDGNIKIWHLKTDGMEQVLSFPPSFVTPDGKPDAVTALAFAPLPVIDTPQMAVLAVGLECGLIELWKIPVTEESTSSSSPVLLLRLENNSCHVATVTKLSWRPTPLNIDRDKGQSKLQLASCSQDHGCRIYEVTI